MNSSAFRSRILHITSTEPLAWEYLEDGVLLVEDGLIRDIGPAKQMEQAGFNLALCEHEPDYLLVPGFIDTHVHSPQLDIIASYGEQLLEWLNRYTFPAEARYEDEAFAATSAVAFLNSLLDAGTTTAMVFATSHAAATDLLFEAAHEKHLRMIIGKVLMDQNAMPKLLDTAVQGVEDSETLIRRWHGTGRLGYAITPRFAGSSSAEQLNLAGLPANMVAIPLLSLVILPLVLCACLFSAMAPGLSGPLFHIADHVIGLLLDYLDWLLDAGFRSVPAKAYPEALLLLGIFALAVLLFPGFGACVLQARSSSRRYCCGVRLKFSTANTS